MSKENLDKAIEKLRTELSNEPAPELAEEPGVEPGNDNGSAHGVDSLQEGVERILADHGITKDDLGDLWDQLRHELHDLPEKKPLVTAMAAFALGVVVGRISKS